MGSKRRPGLPIRGRAEPGRRDVDRTASQPDVEPATLGAMVDGANAWQRFVRVTLPLLRPAILVALIFRTLDALRIFDLPYVLTFGANGTTTLSLYSYEQLTQNGLIGPGSALAVLTFIIVMAVSFSYIRPGGDNIRELATER